MPAHIWIHRGMEKRKETTESFGAEGQSVTPPAPSKNKSFSPILPSTEWNCMGNVCRYVSLYHGIGGRY